jgi:hypothetical protein
MNMQYSRGLLRRKCNFTIVTSQTLHMNTQYYAC